MRNEATLLREKWQFASLPESYLNMQKDLGIEWQNIYWTRLSQNIVIC